MSRVLEGCCGRVRRCFCKKNGVWLEYAPYFAHGIYKRIKRSFPNRESCQMLNEIKCRGKINACVVERQCFETYIALDDFRVAWMAVDANQPLCVKGVSRIRSAA